MIDKIETGKLLKEMKCMAGMTTLDLCEACNVSEQTVYKWFSGKCMPSLTHFFILSELFNCELDNLVVRVRDGKA